MSEVKPSIAELYEFGELDMELVNKIAHNELDKRKGDTRSPVYALAYENIDCYADSGCSEIIENYVAVLDSQLTAEDYGGGKISSEFILGSAIALGAAAQARADIEYFDQEFKLPPSRRWPLVLRKQNSASNGTISPRESHSTRDSRWDISRANEGNRVWMISAPRKARRPTLSLAVMRSVALESKTKFDSLGNEK
ncbi:hypothetical protein DWX55_09980 [Collinsella sp. AF19-7AC]|uniref:hypothetical protein n=1 Tax=unclassified Collinsella TaxID=2637548 RepID=UPI000E480DFC|nr:MULTISPECIES: hypothetical protein [unclassified Collinsella]RGT00871.1 hypothetical protein DWX55_09980 [Collinsella sp. AF19-7AC]RGT28416.1 hypothetical protein DWX39_09635 [Collinsella sp. AF19-1LB]RHE24526.1 hypothetical protein DW754_09905 [Collinsella sp. AM29-10AC]